MGNPHRGDTEVTIREETYTLCYDLNAAAKVMDRLGIKSFEAMASENIDLNTAGLDDLIYILWCGFNRHHPEL